MKISIIQLKELIREQIAESYTRRGNWEKERLTGGDVLQWAEDERKSKLNIKGIHVLEQATVDEAAEVSDGASVMGSCTVTDDAKVRDQAMVGGSAVISDHALVCDNAQVGGLAAVYDNATVGGNARILGQAHIHGKAVVAGKAVVKGNSMIGGTAVIIGGLWEDENVDSGTWSAPGQKVGAKNDEGPYREEE